MGDPGSIPESGRTLEKEMATHSSILAWRIPWTEEPGRLQSTGVAKSWTRLSNFTFTFHFHALEKEMETHSSVLAWRIPGTGEPGGLQSMRSLESDTTERLHFHFSPSCIGEGNGNPVKCSCLENPRNGKPSGLPSMGSHRVGHDSGDLAVAV